MIKTFPIEFVRQALVQTLYEQHLIDPKFFGGNDQVSISSFYQQLKNQGEVDRFVETFRDLSEQQNRLGLIGNGILAAPENPTITNLYSSLIIPMEWTCSMRVRLENRDQMLETINNLIKELKGRKVDMAQLNCVDENGNPYSQPFMVGTIGENDNAPQLENGNYIGEIENASDIDQIFDNLREKGVIVEKNKQYYLYCEHDNKLRVVGAYDGSENSTHSTSNTILVNNRTIAKYIYLDYVIESESKIDTIKSKIDIYGDQHVVLENVPYTIENIAIETIDGQQRTALYVYYHLEKDIQDYVTNYSGFGLITSAWLNDDTYELLENDGTITDILFPQEHDSFEKYVLSMSFDSLRCDTPSTLNSKEYCEISFGGSSTLVNNGVRVGNDLLKIAITKYLIPSETPTKFYEMEDNKTYWLEPLEMPSGSNANTNPIQRMSNKFINNSHTNALALSLQYTFIVDFNNELLEQLFYYARYGTQGLTANKISPNIIYKINEIWCSWGEYVNQEIQAKIVENIDIENTESDTLTISMTFQLQGENN